MLGSATSVQNEFYGVYIEEFKMLHTNHQVIGVVHYGGCNSAPIDSKCILSSLWVYL